MKKQIVAILAPTGMLGSMVYNVLKNNYKLILVYRDKDKLKKLERTYGDTHKHKRILFDLNLLYTDYLAGFPTSKISPRLVRFTKSIGSVDALINCAGITKPHSLTNPLTTLFINGYLPNILSGVYKEKLIHITTDCVYNGITGAPYNEASQKTPNDLYGLSKSLGEPNESLVLRTSIIGPEIDDGEMLLEWLKKQKGKTVQGFANHIWNGITTKQFAIICNTIIQNRTKFPKNGIFHIFSSSVTKYQMLNKLRDRFNVNVHIKAVKAKQPVDRRLTTKYAFCKLLHIPSFSEMLQDL